jgi:hypothetical protein
MAKKSPPDATEWFINHLEEEARQLQSTLPSIKPTSMKRLRIRHGAETMALSMGIKSIAHTPPDKLYLWSVKR